MEQNCGSMYPWIAVEAPFGSFVEIIIKGLIISNWGWEQGWLPGRLLLWCDHHNVARVSDNVLPSGWPGTRPLGRGEGSSKEAPDRPLVSGGCGGPGEAEQHSRTFPLVSGHRWPYLAPAHTWLATPSCWGPGIASNNCSSSDKDTLAFSFIV